MKSDTLVGATRRSHWRLGVYAGLCLIAGAGVTAQAQTNSAPKNASLSDYKLVYERNIFNPKRYARSTGERPRETTRPSRVDTLALVGVMAYEKGTFAFFDGSSADSRKASKQGETVAGLQVASIEANAVILKAGTNEFVLEVGSQLRRDNGGDWRTGGRAEFADARTSTSSRSQVPPNPTPITNTQDQAQQFQPPFGSGEFPQPPEGTFSVGQPMPSPEANGQAPTSGETGPAPEGAPAAAPAAGEQSNAPGDNSANQAAPSSGGSEDDILKRLMDRREQEMNR